MTYTNDELEKYCVVMDELMRYPFNVSQIGFPMIARAITTLVDTELPNKAFSKTVFKKVAEDFNVTVAYATKAMRDTMVTASNNCNYVNVVYPNAVIESALAETKVKSFIVTMSTYINHLRNMQIIEK